MKKRRSLSVGLMLAAALAIPMAATAARAPTEATVQFGQPTFPQDPAPFNHFLLPNEVTIAKGGTVTFEFNGAGHGLAVYPVSPLTTRADIEAGLCQPDPATCFPQGAATSDLQYFVMDGMGDPIVDTGTNPPNNRVDDPTDRLMYAGGPGPSLTGRTSDTAAPQLVQYRFNKIGRYLVICGNRNHFINSRMFGFVNVVRKRQQID